MSYILEALKKSEQARGRGSAPGIQTVHSSGLNYQAPGRSLWPWILIAAVLLNLAVLLYFVFSKHSTAPQTKAEPVMQQAAIALPTRPALQQEISPAPQIRPAEPSAENTYTPTTRPAQISQPSAAEIFQAVDINELPADIRSHIPAMEFSAHVFSSNPQQRSVVINGRFMEEGEKLNDDFILKEITSTGVIMDFQGTLFRTTVITGW